MARIRTIKPEFPQSESMGRVSRDARLTFIELWTLADDSGRLRGNSRMLASLLFPYDDDAKDFIDAWLGELEHERCVVRYCIDGDNYLQICNWLNHQKIDKPTPSKLPPFDESSRKVAKTLEVSSGDLGSGSGPRIKDQGSGPTSQSATAVPRGTDPEWFLEFKLAYPDRAGDQRWREAQRAGRARIAEGHTPLEFIAGAERYAAFIEATGKANTEYVQQAATFLGPGKPFLNPWTAPVPTAVADPMQEFRRNLGLKPNGADHVGKTFEHEPEDTRSVGLLERALRTG